MNRSSEKPTNNVNRILSFVKSTGVESNDTNSGTIGMYSQSCYGSVFAECYDAILWMNENMTPLEGLVNLLT